MGFERSGGASPFRDSEANSRILKWLLEWMSNQWSKVKIREMCMYQRNGVLCHMDTVDGGPTKPHTPCIKISSHTGTKAWVLLWKKFT